MRWQKNSSVNCRHIKIKRAERNKWLLQRTTTEDRTGPDTQAQDTGTLWTGPGSNVTVRGNIWSEWKLETWRDSVTMSRTQTLSHRHDDRVNELTSHERRRHQSHDRLIAHWPLHSKPQKLYEFCLLIIKFWSETCCQLIVPLIRLLIHCFSSSLWTTCSAVMMSQITRVILRKKRHY